MGEFRNNFKKFCSSKKGICLFATVGCSILAYGGKRLMDHYLWKSRMKQKKEYDEFKANLDKKGTDLETNPNNGTDVDEQKPVSFDNLANGEEFDSKEDELIGPWLTKGDICVLYASSKHYKSHIAMQVSMSLANGEKTSLLPDSYDAEPRGLMAVLYYDLEYNDQKFRKRYWSVKDKIIGKIKLFEKIKTAEGIITNLKSHTDHSKDVLAVVDNVSMIEGFYSEEAKTFFNKLKSIQGEFDKEGGSLTYILIAHKKENGRDSDPVSVSTQLVRSATVMYEIIKIDGDRSRIVIRPNNMRDIADTDNVFVMKMTGEHPVRFKYEDTMPLEKALKLTPTSKSQQDKVKSDGRKTFTPDEEKSLYPQIIKLVNEGKSYAQVVEILKNPNVNTSRVQTVMAAYKDGRLSHLFTDEAESK